MTKVTNKTPIITGVDRFIQIESYNGQLDVRLVDSNSESHSQHIFSGLRAFVLSGGVAMRPFAEMERDRDSKLVLED